MSESIYDKVATFTFQELEDILNETYRRGYVEAWETFDAGDSFSCSHQAVPRHLCRLFKEKEEKEIGDVNLISSYEAKLIIRIYGTEDFKGTVPKEKFLAHEKDGTWTAIDNCTGDCWVEGFDSKEDAMEWLNHKC
ncbi:hypothetical protein [uncultured Dialister sp.]|jgi:hypothetical protein|uniref:hypothetical protein n=1 Tax=uncultured Dialister sp. TaxID=278064 RepID=UPI00260CF6A1|nr:hypothetical protein [uncultured Dialister sp.]